MTIPKAELKAAVAGATTAAMVQRNLGDRYGGATFCTDSTICLYWITQDDRPLQTGVRNAVTEIRRFSDTKDWFHITTEKNVADLGTRPALVAEIAPGSAWQIGQPWMAMPRDKMPLMSAARGYAHGRGKAACGDRIAEQGRVGTQAEHHVLRGQCQVRAQQLPG
jgi:hypothetical protein